MGEGTRMKKITKYKNTKVIGVTGGIGSGQSSVCQYFSRWGCKIIDVDKKAKQIIGRDQALKKELRKTFGNEIFFPNGELNRRLLASIAFQDEERTQMLNRLVHPRMVAEVIEEMENARFSQKYPLIVIDAALIYEISIEQMFDAIIVVYTSLKNRIERIIQRDGLTREEIMARVRRQIALEEKRKWAEYVINNDGTLENLEKQARDVFDTITEDVQTARAIRV
jgi:dephospho-CoA kinase